jgi:O-antigen/teichoic acid export membrane protein
MAFEVGGFGLPLVIGNLGAWVLSQFDRYFIQHYFGAREVGLYSAAYTISEHSITMLATFIMVSSTPLLTSEWENRGQQASQHLFVSVTRSYLVLAIPAVVGLSVLAEPLMILLTGAEFAAGYSIVPWVVAGAFFIGLQHRFNQALRLLKRTGDIMLWVLVAAAVNVVLNWWLLPLFGYQIAAVNTFICYVLLCLGQAWISRRHFRWPFPWLTTLRSGVAASIMGSIVLLLKNSVILSPLLILCVAIPSGMLIYGLGLVVFGETSLAELKRLGKRGNPMVNQRNSDALVQPE